MFDITCPNCERPLQLPDDAIARECQCPACESLFVPTVTIQPTKKPIATSSEHITDTLPNSLSYDHDDNDPVVLAERMRLPRDRDDDMESTARELPWSQGKRAAKIGFGISLFAGFLSVGLHPGGFPPKELLANFVILGLLGQFHGFFVVLLAYAFESRFQSWTQKGLVGILVLWILGVVFAQSKANDPVSMECLAYGLGTGIAVVLMAWLFLVGVAMLLRRE